MDTNSIKNAIQNNRTSLGIEMGSTRIKAVLIGENNEPIASGNHDWENRLENGYWTYDIDDAWAGIRDCYKKLCDDVFEKYGESLTNIGSIGFSGMMHGYLPFDASDNLLTPFRTWRNTTTEHAAAELTKMLGFNIPQRWSIAHLHQAILNGEAHVKNISFLTTLAGYVHYKLTGKKVMGVGEASGMFPIDSKACDYNAIMVEKYNNALSLKGLELRLGDILPTVLPAGANGGALTAEGAKLLDPTGALQSGIPMCPPEGDAGTGMVATNSIAVRTGNVSAGTSIFAMIVLEKELSKVYTEIDMVTTPAGKPVAMVHCNTCTSDLDAWVKLFGEVLTTMGAAYDKPKLYDEMYNIALSADKDCGGLLAYNYYSGEPITDTLEGRPLFVRMPDAKFSLANFMRAQLFSTVATLKLGMDILFQQENVTLDKLLGHGGLFKTKLVGQKMMAAAMNTPVAVMETAGEGGAWGVALLAAFMRAKADGETLESFLDSKIFKDSKGVTVEPDPADVDGFTRFIAQYKLGVEIEKTAVNVLK